MKNIGGTALRRSIVGLWLVCVFLVPQAAMGQGFDLQQFSPMPDQENNFFATSSAEVPGHLDWSAMLLFNYSNNPLIRRDADGSTTERLVSHHGTSHLLLSLGLLNRFELGLDVPLVVLQQGAAIPGAGVSPESAGMGIGDVRLVPKMQIFSTRANESADGIALAVLIDTHLPTGNDEYLQGGDFRIGPRLAFDAVLGGPRIGANLGYLYRGERILENLAVRDTLSWNVGVAYPVGDSLEITGEFFGRLTPGAEEIRTNESPAEFLLGGKFRQGNLLFVAGGGTGIVSGYGAPDFRAFAGVSWVVSSGAPEEIVEISEIEEPVEAECHVETAQSDCADVPTSLCEDGVIRTYGAECSEGACVYAAVETPCGDGMICDADGELACVAAPECGVDGDCTAIPDSTCADGVLTTYGAQCREGGCHYEAVETACGADQECGRQARAAACVEVTELASVDEETERIEIEEVVLFAVNSHEIDSRSHRLLDQVAQVLENHPQVRRVRIEGHTDDAGRASHNQRLSQRRADAVRQYLIDRGVEAERLRAVGLGEIQPLATNETEAGRATNRRVEFHIEARD